MKKAKIKNKIRNKVVRTLNAQQPKVSRGVHPYPTPQLDHKNHKKAQ